MKNKKFEVFFDMMSYLYDGASGDFKMVTKEGTKAFKPKQVQAFVGKSLHDFVTTAYAADPERSGKAIQAFTGTADMEEITKNVWNAFQEVPNYDMFWQEAFRTVPLRKGQLSWEIGNVASGVTFDVLEEGEKVEYRTLTGSKATGTVALYGGGLSISWQTLEGRDLAAFYNAMMDFRGQRMAKYAEVHYGLLNTAAATNTVAWGGASGDSDLSRDIKTLNSGYYTIGNACKDLGFGDTANARMLLYCSPALKGRISQAINATSADLVRSASGTQDANLFYGSLVPRYTFTDQIAANKAVMVLPGHKIQNAIYMDEKSFERLDPDNLNWLKSSFTAFGGVIGEADQCALLSFA